ncbi:hypothetical protein BVY01_01530 [bacterium I07]|nr:hypothetical protein BVY01_01530 [bacterium I07]
MPDAVTQLNASLLPTSVGSFPHTDVNEACDLILENFPEMPVWPQLPGTSLNEQMEIQYSEGMPCIVIDCQKERMYFDTDGDPTAALETFYENVINDNVNYFNISEAYSRGIYAMEKRLKSSNNNPIRYFKMQVTGPVSFGLTIVDENKRAIYYNDIFRDTVVKGIAMKARWLLRKFQPLIDKRICFIDEPILSAFGSSTYVSVKRDDVVSHLTEVVDAVHAEGALAGIHCCGNTEWTIPIDTGADIINFDAYGYGETLGLYPEQLKSFLEKGGVLAWGIVPTSEMIDKEDAKSLASLFESLVDGLVQKGIDRDRLINQAIFTASCGTGSVPVERAERVARETRVVSDLLRERYGESI